MIEAPKTEKVNAKEVMGSLMQQVANTGFIEGLRHA